MKIAATIVRILIGLLFLFGSVTYFLKLFPEPQLEGKVKIFMEGVNATGYLMSLIKFTELVCGIAFVLGRFVPLACVVIAPVIVNIFFFHLFVDFSIAGIITATILVLGNLFLAFVNWDKFKPLLEAK